MIHGLDGCRLCELYGQFPAIASQINRAGYSVLLIDLRGHGDSPPARVTFGDTERWDVLGRAAQPIVVCSAKHDHTRVRKMGEHKTL